MSEQSPLQSSVGVFVEWAKARLDEMAAIAKVLESRLIALGKGFDDLVKHTVLPTRGAAL
jgi:hypothetical protein